MSGCSPVGPHLGAVPPRLVEGPLGSAEGLWGAWTSPVRNKHTAGPRGRVERGLLSWLWASSDRFTVYPNSSQENALAMLIPHRTMTLDLEQLGLGERLSSGMQGRPRPRMEPERWWRPWLVLSQRVPQKLPRTLRAAPAAQSATSEHQESTQALPPGSVAQQQGGGQRLGQRSAVSDKGDSLLRLCLSAASGACTGSPWDVSLHTRPTCLNTSFL